MMSHTQPADVLVTQAKLMESYGADCVYVVDSAGAMVQSGVREKVSALKDALSIEVGFHGHNNLGLAIGNTITALEAGADQIDGTLRGLGAGAGNAPTEVLTAVLNKMGIETGINLSILMDTAEEVIAPLMTHQLSSIVIIYQAAMPVCITASCYMLERQQTDLTYVLLKLWKSWVSAKLLQDKKTGLSMSL